MCSCQGKISCYPEVGSFSFWIKWSLTRNTSVAEHFWVYLKATVLKFDIVFYMHACSKVLLNQRFFKGKKIMFKMIFKQMGGKDQQKCFEILGGENYLMMVVLLWWWCDAGGYVLLGSSLCLLLNGYLFNRNSFFQDHCQNSQRTTKTHFLYRKKNIFLKLHSLKI